MCQDIGKSVVGIGKVGKGDKKPGPKALRSVATKGFGPWRRGAHTPLTEEIEAV